MKLIILLSALVAVSLSLPIDDDKTKPETLRYEYNNNGDKGYNFA
jgi:hypothetical protein